MPARSALTLTALLLLAACNKPAPTPEAAGPDTGSADTVAAAGAPIADSANTMTDSAAAAGDSAANAADSTVTVTADSTTDSTAN